MRSGAEMSPRVIVVGGGVIGSSVAYFLASHPHFTGEIAVVERDPTYARASSARSASAIRQQFSTAVNIEISRFGIEFLRAVGARLGTGDETPDIGLCEPGYLFLATPAGVPVLERNHRLQRAHGVDVALLDAPALAARFPWLKTGGVAAGSLGLSGEGWFDGYALLQAFRRKAQSLGVRYVAAEVTGFAREGSRVRAVVTAGGSVMPADAVVNARPLGGRGRGDARHRAPRPGALPLGLHVCLPRAGPGVPARHRSVRGVVPGRRAELLMRVVAVRGRGRSGRLAARGRRPPVLRRDLARARRPRPAVRGREVAQELGRVLRDEHLRPQRHRGPASIPGKRLLRQRLQRPRPAAVAGGGTRPRGADRRGTVPEPRPDPARVYTHRGGPAFRRAQRHLSASCARRALAAPTRAPGPGASAPATARGCSGSAPG